MPPQACTLLTMLCTLALRVGFSELDGGFEAHKFIHRSISRDSYVEVLGCLQCVLAQCQAAYPDLWAVLQFVPMKNGLNPHLALLARWSAEP